MMRAGRTAGRRISICTTKKRRRICSPAARTDLAHCISADFAMGKGIAADMEQRFGLREQLRWEHSGYQEMWAKDRRGDALRTGCVFNLVTKERYFHKSTLRTMCEALTRMRDIAGREGIRRIAMPRIGCGLDRLSWEDVRQLIHEVFGRTDAEILVCTPGKEKSNDRSSSI